MEQRLFLAACVMYIFSLLSKCLFKKNSLESPIKFAAWNSVFLLFILGCAYFIFSFLTNSEIPAFPEEKSLSLKTIILWTLIVGTAIYGFFSAKKKDKEQKQSLIKTNMDWANTVYFAGFVASIIMFFFVQAFKIPSESMQNTLLVGDHLFVNKAAYGFRIPLTQIRFLELDQIKKGDVIVFKFPAKNPEQINCGGYQYGRDYVKRVVALPGDKVEIKDAQLYINDTLVENQGYEIFETIKRIEKEDVLSDKLYQKLWEEHKLEHLMGLSVRDNFGPVIVPEGSYFAMGDNRDNSCDSRFWGPVPRENIKGTAWFIHWPFSRLGWIK